jgi:hypothetical protein
LRIGQGAGAAVITTESITSYYQLHHRIFLFCYTKSRRENEKKEKLLPQLQLLPTQAQEGYLFKLETYLKKSYSKNSVSRFWFFQVKLFKNKILLG